MPVRSPRNEYQGVNAHLHSYFQKHGGWDGFHDKHVGDLGAPISTLLPNGYLVDTEQLLPLQKLPPYKPYLALLIYRIEPDALLGRAITQIELLSPTNKQGEGYRLYREKRIAVLNAGINLVEIDYLHETDPVVRGVPSYSRHASNAHPYNITVSIPSPSLREGKAITSAFDVDMPIPMLHVPLEADKSIMVDLNAIYQHTFASMNAYSFRVDYALLPERFDTYSPADQDHIRARIESVLSQQQPI